MRTPLALMMLVTIAIAAPTASAFEDWDEPMEVPLKAGDQVTKVRVSPATMSRALKAMGFETFGQLAAADVDALATKYNASKGLDLDATLALDEKFEIKFWTTTVEAAKKMDADKAISPASARKFLQLQGKMQHE